MRTIYLLIGILLWTSSCKKADQETKNLKLWYTKPAQQWVEALPVGNGRMGAMVFGRTGTERIQLNEESLWSGQPINNNNPEALKHLEEVRRLLIRGRNFEAKALADQYFLGTPPRIRSYQNLMDLYLVNQGDSNFSNYERELDIINGIARTHYTIGGAEYTEEVWASAQDDVIVISLKTDKKGAINVNVQAERKRDAGFFIQGSNKLIMQGQIIDEPDSLRGPGGKHMKFSACVTALNSGGSISSSADPAMLEVRNTDHLLLLISSATNYDPETLSLDRGKDPLAVTKEIVNRASSLEYDRLKQRHIEEHRTLMNRVSLDLGQSADSLPTDQRLERVKKGEPDHGLIALYFQYGRYLLMGSSRKPGLLPANLQGIWNKDLFAPWGSDYHVNINLQMNYWPAEVTNLSETTLPLIHFIDKLRAPGRVTAREMYGADGWTIHHTTDVFGRSGVMDGIHWGMFPMGGPWLTLPVWRHYEYTQDTTYLRETAWPVMKGSADFVLDFIFESPKGILVTAPSYSPENSFIHPVEQKPIRLTYAPTMDIQIIRELFQNCITASEILNTDIDNEFRETLRKTLQKLPPTQIGEDGTIMEWIHDYEDAEPGHRHMSHLFGLHPGTQITSADSQLYEAAAKTIAKRLSHGGGHTGWSRAWIINFYARLRNGNKAYENMVALLQKSTLPNLFDDHPPFQIDGNFGAVAGIAEMLVQSYRGKIILLPALPEAWKSGSVNGLLARGGYEISIVWDNGLLKGVTVKSRTTDSVNIVYGNKSVILNAEKDKVFNLDDELHISYH